MRNFKEFNQLTEVAKYGSIDMKSVKTYEDALDPEVYVFGMATYSLSIIKRRIAEILEDMADDMRTSMKSDKLQYGEQFQNTIENRLKYFIGALADVEKQMKTPQYKRRTTMLKNKR
jgi:NADPH-dependent curcumin reductase CurA